MNYRTRWKAGQEFVKHTVALWGSREKLNVSNPIRKETDSQISTESLESVNRADQQGEEKHWYWPSAPPAQSTIQFNNSYLYLRGGKHPNTFPADIRPSLIGVKILPESVWYVKLKTELRLWSHFPSSPIKQQKNLLYLLPTGPNRPGSAPQSACVCSMSPAAPKDGIGWHGPKKINNQNFP